MVVIAIMLLLHSIKLYLMSMQDGQISVHIGSSLPNQVHTGDEVASSSGTQPRSDVVHITV